MAVVVAVIMCGCCVGSGSSNGSRDSSGSRYGSGSRDSSGSGESSGSNYNDGTCGGGSHVLTSISSVLKLYILNDQIDVRLLQFLVLNLSRYIKQVQL